MAANYKSSMSSTAPLEQVNESLVQAAKDLVDQEGWQLQDQTPCSAKFKVGVNLFSWGEVVTVSIDGGSVAIRSECRFPLQFIDWGKNRKNVALAEALIQKRCDAPALSRHQSGYPLQN